MEDGTAARSAAIGDKNVYWPARSVKQLAGGRQQSSFSAATIRW